ncbi:hypothetical protein V8B55DRAFT_1523296 [Mucor lusitanicus]|uniref:WWE domain-containing protein n=2 Tax=Mucor circinelloides f. lusitanicus TaxID=29924 RepID=A0A168LN26_MUCCL|nr:hypothetical protein MUCCIDRAFT_81719 [Mucor lusitanicus CBS 277.49]
MSVGPELSIMYHHNSQQYYSSTPLIIAQHQQYRIQQEQSQPYHQQRSPFYDQMINDQQQQQHNKQQQSKHKQQPHSFSPPLSVASSSSASSGSFYSSLSSSPPPANTAFHIHAAPHANAATTQMRIKKKLPATFNASQTTSSATHLQPSSQSTKTSAASWNFTWLVFMNEKWVPFDILNQTKLEQTLTVGGTFVDINDSHFPDVKRVRVFPKSNYLSYLGVKYRLSRIMQPDAYLDHVGVAEAKKPSSLPMLPASLPTADEGGDSRTQRAWEM